jgi:hypothetical protein
VRLERREARRGVGFVRSDVSATDIGATPFICNVAGVNGKGTV